MCACACDPHWLDLQASQGPPPGPATARHAFTALTDALKLGLCGCNCGYKKDTLPACVCVSVQVCVFARKWIHSVDNLLVQSICQLYLPVKMYCSISSGLIVHIVIHISGFWSVFHTDLCQWGINNASLEKDTQHVSNKHYALLSSFLMFE